MAEQPENPEGRISTRLDRADQWTFAVTALLTFVGYLLTLAPEVTLEWSGILTTSAMYGGVGPPAGNPAWTLYSWLFIKLLPFSNPAWRVAVGSAVAAALSSGLVALTISRSARMLFAGDATFERLTPREQSWIRGMSGYAAGMALGYSDSYWYEALVADFRTFTVLLITIILYLMLRWMETGRRWLCWLAFFIYGMLLTNSQEMLTALPGMGGAILVMDRKLGRDLCLLLFPIAAMLASFTEYRIWDYGIADWPLLVVFTVPILVAIGLAIAGKQIGSEWKTALACTLCFLLGLAFYFCLPIVSATNPPVNWAYPRDLEGFLHSVGRGQFEHINPVNNVPEFAAEMGRFILQTGGEFGWFYVLLAALPFCRLRRMKSSGRKWLTTLILISLGIGPLLAALLNAPSGRQSQELLELSFLPFRVPLAICTGLGLVLVASFGRAGAAAPPQYPLVTQSPTIPPANSQ